MITVDVHEDDDRLARLVRSLEDGSVEEIVLARNGRPAARLVALGAGRPGVRLGLARGRFQTPEPDAKLDEDVAVLFGTAPPPADQHADTRIACSGPAGIAEPSRRSV
jgi:antitoxin (DNA-binding transcriptional repressor) of toxin-antitoxin stability system